MVVPATIAYILGMHAHSMCVPRSHGTVAGTYAMAVPVTIACILETFNTRPWHASRGHTGASPGCSRGSSRHISFLKEMSFWKDSYHSSF